jgi:hypothetical protein
MSNERVPLRRVEPERLLHQTGEALLRRDFSDQAAQDDQVRWWHARALHNAWGIAQGLKVSNLGPGNLAKLSAGVAYDLFGRELVLDQVQRIPVPKTGDEYLLVLSYDRPAVECEPPGGFCIDSFVAASGVRLSWLPRRTWTAATGVPLAILNEDDTCALPFARPYVRPMARPTVGHGTLTVSSRDFTPWRIDAGDEPAQIGWQYAVDTSAAGFARIPKYFVEIAIPVADAPPELILTAGRYHLAEAELGQFSIRYFSPAQLRSRVLDRRLFSNLDEPQIARFGVRRGLATVSAGVDIDVPIRISWIGVEPRQDLMRAENEVDDEFHS